MRFSLLFSLSSVTPLSLFGHPFVFSLFSLHHSLYKKTESGVCVKLRNACRKLVYGFMYLFAGEQFLQW
jgi:hypothetical protein